MNRTPALDVAAVQAFVKIADLKSFTRAARALGTTQAAISAKLKRLEERVGLRLVERTPRSVRLSAQGAVFLNSARDFLGAHERAMAGIAPERHFAIGIASELGASEIPTLLARLRAHDPALTIEVRRNSAGDLLEAFDRGEIDAVVVRREDDRRDGESLGLEQFSWFAAPNFVHRANQPLRLAASSPSCGIHDTASRALRDAGMKWATVVLGCGPLVVSDAVAAGLATGVFSTRLVPPGTVDVSDRFCLPRLPSSEVVLLSALSDPESRSVLRALSAAFREHRARAAQKLTVLKEPEEAR